MDKAAVIRTLNALWEYREALRQRSGKACQIANAHGQLLTLINRLEGRSGPADPSDIMPRPAFDRPKITKIKADLIGLSALAPQSRGYALKRFLKDIFDAYGLAAHEPFRLRGEQIDGSFQFGHEAYLVEAKWHNQPMGVAELHTFHGKIEQKATWGRGLFVSNSGFTDEGLTAFGRGKRVVCMDGYDLYETPNREIPLQSCPRAQSSAGGRNRVALRSDSRPLPTVTPGGNQPMVQLNDWCNATDTNIGARALCVLSADPARIHIGISAAAAIVPEHYATEEQVSRILTRLGKPAAAAFIRGKLPTTRSIRSGELCEILATEFIVANSDYSTPIKRLQWKDHRNMAMRF